MDRIVWQVNNFLNTNLKATPTALTFCKNSILHPSEELYRKGQDQKWHELNWSCQNYTSLLEVKVCESNSDFHYFLCTGWWINSILSCLPGTSRTASSSKTGSRYLTGDLNPEGAWFIFYNIWKSWPLQISVTICNKLRIGILFFQTPLLSILYLESIELKLKKHKALSQRIWHWKTYLQP